MTFLNPTFLWAAFAIAIPIIVHLFNFRRPQRVAFSDVSLVKEVQKTVVKKLRLRQWLLLATRCLAILSLVLVFANPVLRSEDRVQKEGSTSVAIMIDNSYSMTGGNDKGSYWLQAQKLGNEIVKAYSRTDEFLVMTNHEPMVHFNFAEKQAALKSLTKLEIKQNMRSLPEILTLTEDLFSHASNPNRVFYFISDFQKSTILPDSSFSFSSPEGCEIHLVPLTTRKLKNAFVSESDIVSQIIEKKKPVNFELNLVNDAKEEMKNVGLRVVLDRETRPLATEDLGAGQTRNVKFNLTPQSAGWQSGYIELDDSPIDFDNQRFFSYYVPDREKMLVVEEQAVPHLRLMLGEKVLSQVDVKFISARNFSGEDLADYKSILWVGATEISTGLEEKLIAHLEEGKSILMFPGTSLKMKSMNRFFGSLGLGQFQGQGPRVYEGGKYARGVDLQHPVFEGVFSGERSAKNFDAPSMFKHYTFRTQNDIVQNVILKMDNLDPILIESHPKGGLFYTFTMYPSEAWTDFTLKSSGLAMMVQLARMMNQTQQARKSEDLGGNGYKRVKTNEKDVIKMVGADGIEVIPEQFVQRGYIVLKFGKQDLTEGNYDLYQKEQLLEKISFNVPDAESRLWALNEQELKDHLIAINLPGLKVSAASEGTFRDEIQMNSQGIPLWKCFLIAGLLFFLAEFLLLFLKPKNKVSA